MEHSLSHTVSPHHATGSLDQPDHQYHEHDQHDAAIDLLIVFGEPVGEVDVEIRCSGIGVAARYHRQWAVHPERKEYQNFKAYKPKADPEPTIDVVNDHCVEQIEYDDVVARPYKGMQCFDRDKLLRCIHAKAV